MPVDDKRLASWNGLMLQALVVAASFDDKYRPAAEKQYDFMLDSFIENDEVIRFAANAGLAETNFEDYAQLSLAFLQYGQAFDKSEAIDWAQKLAISAYRRFFDNNRWHMNSASIIPTDPGRLVIQDAVSPSAQTTWLKVILALAGIEEIIDREANEILRRVTREMLDTPYYYSSLIALRRQLTASTVSKNRLQ